MSFVATGLIFNSVTQYVIQAERTKQWVKRNELDRLEETWVGPSELEDWFKPAIGTLHPDYNLMSVINVATRRFPAKVSEITITYQGKLFSASGGIYTSAPTISTYWMEGEVGWSAATSIEYSWTVGGTSLAGQTGAPTAAAAASQASVTPAIVGSGVGPIPGVPTATYYPGSSVISGFPSAPGMASYSRRYDGFCADFAYITNARPSGANPKFENQAQPYLGFQNVFDILTGLQAGNQMFSQGVMQQLCCTNVAIQDRADGWYEVTESWQSRMLTSGHYG